MEKSETPGDPELPEQLEGENFDPILTEMQEVLNRYGLEKYQIQDITLISFDDEGEEEVKGLCLKCAWGKGCKIVPC